MSVVFTLKATDGSARRGLLDTRTGQSKHPYSCGRNQGTVKGMTQRSSGDWELRFSWETLTISFCDRA